MKRTLYTLAIATLALVTPMQAADDKDIVDTAVEAGSFTTLPAALDAVLAPFAVDQPAPDIVGGLARR